MGPDMGCENFTAMSNYLNLPAVQAAINVKVHTLTHTDPTHRACANSVCTHSDDYRLTLVL